MNGICSIQKNPQYLSLPTCEKNSKKVAAMSQCASPWSCTFPLPEVQTNVVALNLAGAFILFGSVVLEIKPRALGMLGKHYTTELYF